MGRVSADARTVPLNATRYVSLPLVVRSTKAAMAWTDAFGVGDGRADEADEPGPVDGLDTELSVAARGGGRQAATSRTLTPRATPAMHKRTVDIGETVPARLKGGCRPDRPRTGGTIDPQKVSYPIPPPGYLRGILAG
jgi:hypothetical protein